MNFWKDIIVPLVTGKKTITRFEAGGFNVRIAILPGVNNPREFDRERLDAALKEAMDNVLTELVEKEKTSSPIS
jgi:hypothetical protein